MSPKHNTASKEEHPDIANAENEQLVIETSIKHDGIQVNLSILTTKNASCTIGSDSISPVQLESYGPPPRPFDKAFQWPTFERLKVDGKRPRTVVFQEPSPLYRSESPCSRDRQISSDEAVQDGGPDSGIVLILAIFHDPFGKATSAHGTGFVIDDHHVLTAGHTIWPVGPCGIAKNIIIYPDSRFPSEPYYVDSGAVHFDWTDNFLGKNDQAVLHVPTPFPPGIRRMKYEQTPVMTSDGRVKAYGYPLDFPENRNGIWPAYVSHTTTTTARYADGNALLRHWGHTEKGNSGGPIVDDYSGKAIAVHIGADNTGALASTINRNGNDVEKWISSIAASAGIGQAGDSQRGKGASFKYHGWSVTCFT